MRCALEAINKKREIRLSEQKLSGAPSFNKQSGDQTTTAETQAPHVEEDLQRAEDSAMGSWSKEFELDIRLREFEINQLTQRNSFFMIFQGVLIAGLIQSHGLAAPLITFWMSLLGIAISVLQIAMAGGAKYWQSRWEASTRSFELAVVMQLEKANRNAVRIFTHDLSLLSAEEQAMVENWSRSQVDSGRHITQLSGFINQVVKRDVEVSRRNDFRFFLNWWVRNWAIFPQWSVSKIPIWAAAAMLLFWAVIWLHTWKIPVIGKLRFFLPEWIELMP